MQANGGVKSTVGEGQNSVTKSLDVNKGSEAVENQALKSSPRVEVTVEDMIGPNGQDISNMPASTVENPLDGTTYTEKVLLQRQPNSKTGLPDDHGFPSIVDNYASDGEVTSIVGGDGNSRTLVEVSGTYNGNSGKFQWMIESDKTINHRFFKKGVK